MKKWFLLLMISLLSLLFVYFLFKTEPKVQFFLNQKIPALKILFGQLDFLFQSLGLDFRWSFLFLFILFLLVEFAPSHAYKRSPGLPKVLAFVFGIAFILTLSLILFIYNLPYDRMNIGQIVIDRGPKDKFLGTILHYTIIIGNAHFIGLLLVAFWIEISKGKEYGEE
ncbi:MAG: hypothetical protein D6785_15660 [Planctomycetota bacterium]|nr:MAG: hypothetical protein D6785_15660 [Planctomycetota bacterium]